MALLGLKLKTTAECKIKTKGSTRVLQKDHDVNQKEPDFNYKLFLQMLWPDFWYLVAAVIVSDEQINPIYVSFIFFKNA